MDYLECLNRNRSKFTTTYIDNEYCLVWNEKINWTFKGFYKDKNNIIHYDKEHYIATTENGLGFVIIAKGKFINETTKFINRFNKDSLIPKFTERTKLNKIEMVRGV